MLSESWIVAGFGTGFLLEVLHTGKRCYCSMNGGTFSIVGLVAEFNLTPAVDLLQELPLAVIGSFHLP